VGNYSNYFQAFFERPNMESLANLECFVRSAETGGFSTAARRLSLTPAAVSRNVATLERNLGVRLFHRSTRKLTLTEAGARFLHAVRGSLEELQTSIAAVATGRGEPAGVLKVSLGLTFGVDYILPLLPEFLKLYPDVRPHWQFEGRQAKDSMRRSVAASSWCRAWCLAHLRRCT